MDEKVKIKILDVLEEHYRISLWSETNRNMLAKKIAINLGEENNPRTSDPGEVTKPSYIPDAKVVSVDIDEQQEVKSPLNAMAGQNITVGGTRRTIVPANIAATAPSTHIDPMTLEKTKIVPTKSKLKPKKKLGNTKQVKDKKEESFFPERKKGGVFKKSKGKK